MNLTRRKILTSAAGAALAAGALPAMANNDDAHADVLYGHGMVWNRNRKAAPAEVNPSFDLPINLETGQGFGTAEDPVHPDWNLHFAINSTRKQKVRGGETRYTMIGVVTEANN